MTLSGTTTNTSPSAIRFAAMNLLAMREHSSAELNKKLLHKFKDDQQAAMAIPAVLAQLAAEGLQSDVRFAEAFIAMRKRQGKGQVIIQLELRHHEIATETIQDLLAPQSEEWMVLACTVREKKFGGTLPVDPKEKAKQMRFLTARGFASRCVQRALKYHDE